MLMRLVRRLAIFGLGVLSVWLIVFVVFIAMYHLMPGRVEKSLLKRMRPADQVIAEQMAARRHS